MKKNFLNFGEYRIQAWNWGRGKKLLGGIPICFSPEGKEFGDNTKLFLWLGSLYSERQTYQPHSPFPW